MASTISVNHAATTSNNEASRFRHVNAEELNVADMSGMTRNLIPGAVVAMCFEVLALVVAASSAVAAAYYATAVSAGVTAMAVTLSIGVHLKEIDKGRDAAAPGATQQSGGTASNNEPPSTQQPAAKELGGSLLLPTNPLAAGTSPNAAGGAGFARSVSLTSITMTAARSPSAVSRLSVASSNDRDAHRIVVASGGAADAAHTSDTSTPQTLSRISSGVNDTRKVAAASNPLASGSGHESDVMIASIEDTTLLPGLTHAAHTTSPQSPVNVHIRGGMVVQRKRSIPPVSHAAVAATVVVVFAYLGVAIAGVLETHVPAFSVCVMGSIAHLSAPWLVSSSSQQALVQTLALFLGVAAWLALALVGTFAIGSIGSGQATLIEGIALNMAVAAIAAPAIARLMWASRCTFTGLSLQQDKSIVESGIWATLADDEAELDVSWLGLIQDRAYAEALGQLIDELKESRKFVPREVSERPTSPVHSNTSAMTIGMTSVSSSVTPPAMSGRKPNPSRPVSRLLNSVANMTFNESFAAPAAAPPKMRCLVVCAQLRLATETTRFNDFTALTSLYHAVEKVSKPFPGVTILPGSGHSVLLVFRSPHQTEAVARNALRCALSVSQRCAHEGVEVSVCVLSGFGFVGAFGTSSKTVRLVGPLCDAAADICALGEQLRANVLCDEEVAADCALTHLCNPVDVVQLPCWGVPRIVYRPVKAFDRPQSSSEAMEWMYDLQIATDQTPPLAWALRRAFIQFARGDYSGAARALESTHSDVSVEWDSDVEVEHLTRRCAALIQLTTTTTPPTTAIPVIVNVALGVGVPAESVALNHTSVLKPGARWT